MRPSLSFLSSFKKKKFPGRSGQSLVEALVALGILTVGFLGITTLLNKSYSLERINSANTQATYLAAEGIEIVKSLVDHDVYYGLWQSNGLHDDWQVCFPIQGTPESYELDYTTVTDMNDDNCPLPNYQGRYLGFDPTTGFYSYGGPVQTDFIRKITVTNPNNYETEVDSLVTWTDGSISTKVDLQDVFYNWHP